MRSRSLPATTTRSHGADYAPHDSSAAGRCDPGRSPAEEERDMIPSRSITGTELVARAIASIDARAELAASSGRIVQAVDEQHRRVVRDLHDGVQSRLVP